VIEQLREKEKCDLVVCLSHLGIEIQGISDEEVIASTSGIDLLLGGHTHTLMNEPRIYLNENGKDVPAMHTGRNGAHIGKIEITIN
jgi:5'-nucleotidase